MAPITRSQRKNQESLEKDRLNVEKSKAFKPGSNNQHTKGRVQIDPYCRKMANDWNKDKIGEYNDDDGFIVNDDIFKTDDSENESESESDETESIGSYNSEDSKEGAVYSIINETGLLQNYDDKDETEAEFTDYSDGGELDEYEYDDGYDSFG